MKSIAVIGLGQFGYQTAIGLSRKGFDVIAIDQNTEIVEEIKDHVSQAVSLDTTDEKAMRAVNIETVDIAVVAIGTNLVSSLLTSALLQKLNVQEIYVRAIMPLQENILHSMGISNVINIEKDMGIQFSHSISSGKLGRYIEISDKHSLLETVVPEKFVGKTLQELNLRHDYGVNVVGIKNRLPEVQDDGEIGYKTVMTDVPDPTYPLKKEDVLVIVGTDENIGRFTQEGDTLEDVF